MCGILAGRVHRNVCGEGYGLLGRGWERDWDQAREGSQGTCLQSQGRKEWLPGGGDEALLVDSDGDRGAMFSCWVDREMNDVSLQISKVWGCKDAGWGIHAVF